MVSKDRIPKTQTAIKGRVSCLPQNGVYPPSPELDLFFRFGPKKNQVSLHLLSSSPSDQDSQLRTSDQKNSHQHLSASSSLGYISKQASAYLSHRRILDISIAIADFIYFDSLTAHPQCVPPLSWALSPRSPSLPPTFPSTPMSLIPPSEVRWATVSSVSVLEPNSP